MAHAELGDGAVVVKPVKDDDDDDDETEDVRKETRRNSASDDVPVEPTAAARAAAFQRPHGFVPLKKWRRNIVFLRFAVVEILLRGEQKFDRRETTKMIVTPNSFLGFLLVLPDGMNAKKGKQNRH